MKHVDIAESCLVFRYDLVDLTRQSLSKLANEVYLNAIHAFWHKDAQALSIHSLKFLQLIKDIDKLLASDDNFLLGPWLESAKGLSLNADEKKQVRKCSSSSFDEPTNQLPQIDIYVIDLVRVECKDASNNVVRQH